MNKLLSAASAVGMLLAVNAAQADVLTAEQMDTITAGATASISASVLSGPFSGTVTGTVQTAPTVLANVIFIGSSPVGSTATTNVSAAAGM